MASVLWILRALSRWKGEHGRKMCLTFENRERLLLRVSAYYLKKLRAGMRAAAAAKVLNLVVASAGHVFTQELTVTEFAACGNGHFEFILSKGRLGLDKAPGPGLWTSNH